MAASSESPKRPTMIDVANRAGVSLKTVSRVVNKVPTVDQVMVEKVQLAVRELGFRPNQMAATLKSGSLTSTIGLVIKDISNEFYSTIALGASAVTNSHDSQLITSNMDESVTTQGEMEIIFDLCRRRTDGLLIIPTTGDHSVLETEMRMGTPMVFLDRAPENLEADSVVLDNFGGAAMAARDLIERGHRRIGMVVDSLDLVTMRQRLDGVEHELRAAGLELEPELLATGAHDPKGAAAAAASLLDLAEPPTAIFAGNNRASIGVVEEVWKRGLDTAIVGFDDFHLAHLMPVPITLVSYDTAEIGRLGAEILFRRIAGDDSPPAQVTLPVRLVRSGLGSLSSPAN